MWNVLVFFVGFTLLKKLISSIKKLKCNQAFFLAFVIWLRFFLSAYHEFTFPPLIAGMSINALASILVIAASFFVIPTHLWQIKKLLPLYFFILCIIISAALSGQFIQSIAVITKWLYFIVIALLTYQVMKRHGETVTLNLLLIPFSFPIILQVLSILMGYAKQTEADGSASFIGGYNHEAVFSIVILTFLFLVVLLNRKYIKFQPFVVAFAIFCLLMANYRTALLGAIPILLTFYWGYTINSVIKAHRSFIVIFMVFITFCFVAIVLPIMSERFADIAIVIENADELFKAARYYTDEEQDLFSARVYIWSQYLTEFFNASGQVWMTGFGPDFWKNSHSLYAHNTFVSYLYEFGFIGFFFFLWLLSKPVITLLKVTADSTRNRLLSAHIGFFIINNATMPLWQIEGVIFYGILTGYTWFYCSHQQVVSAQKPVY